MWTQIRLIWVHTSLFKSQADDKADDNCCDWRFKSYVIHSRQMARGYTLTNVTGLSLHNQQGIADVSKRIDACCDR